MWVKVARDLLSVGVAVAAAAALLVLLLLLARNSAASAPSGNALHAYPASRQNMAMWQQFSPHMLMLTRSSLSAQVHDH